MISDLLNYLTEQPVYLLILFFILLVFLSYIIHLFFRKIKLENEPFFSIIFSFLLTLLLFNDIISETTYLKTIIIYLIPFLIPFSIFHIILTEIEFMSKTKNIIFSSLLSIIIYTPSKKITEKVLFSNIFSILFLIITLSFLLLSLHLEHKFRHSKGFKRTFFVALFLLTYTFSFYFVSKYILNINTLLFSLLGLLFGIFILYLHPLYLLTLSKASNLNELIQRKKFLESKLEELKNTYPNTDSESEKKIIEKAKKRIEKEISEINMKIEKELEKAKKS